jgi:uncharacterized protein YbaR (Trm112 family)
MYPFSIEFNPLLQCPNCETDGLKLNKNLKNNFLCNNCKKQFPIIDGIPIPMCQGSCRLN